jgi:hypothetical protein
VGARVGRSIALSSSQTQGHNITQGSLNQGGCRAAPQAATLKSILLAFLLEGTVVGLRQGLSPLNNRSANVTSTIHLSSFRLRMRATTSKVWDESEFERHYAKTSGEEISNSASQQACLPRLSWEEDQTSYCIRVGGRTFLVSDKVVRLISPHSKSTCFSVAKGPDMPSAEVLASALLHLKNNPKLFKKWRKKAGCTLRRMGGDLEAPRKLAALEVSPSCSPHLAP